MVKGRYFLRQRDQKCFPFQFYFCPIKLMNSKHSPMQNIVSFTRKGNAVSSYYNSLPIPYSTSLSLPNKINVFSFILLFPGN